MQPRHVALALALTFGVLLGIGGFTFRYAAGASYLRRAPEACINCHIMQPQYDGWLKGPHHGVAVCVDCHLPEPFFARYYTKAENGWRHGKKFTTGDFHEPIELAPAARRILEANCVRCHRALVADAGADDCLHCHATVGHGERAAIGGPQRETRP